MKLRHGMLKALLALLLCGSSKVGAFNSLYTFSDKALRSNNVEKPTLLSQRQNLQTQMCETQLAFVPTSSSSKTALFAKKKKGGGPKGAAAAALAALEELEQGVGEEIMSKKDQLRAQQEKEKTTKKKSRS